MVPFRRWPWTTARAFRPLSEIQTEFTYCVPVSALHFIPPCSPITAKSIPVGDDWLHEPKLTATACRLPPPTVFSRCSCTESGSLLVPCINREWKGPNQSVSGQYYLTAPPPLTAAIGRTAIR